MQKQILVKTPLTTNGQDVVFDENDKRTYTESILLDSPGKYGARAILEHRNSTLPPALKMIISDYVEESVPIAMVQPPVPQVSMLDQLKAQAETERMKAENEALKQQLAEMQEKNTAAKQDQVELQDPEPAPKQPAKRQPAKRQPSNATA